MDVPILANAVDLGLLDNCHRIFRDVIGQRPQEKILKHSVGTMVGH
ncbi:MAG TPA: hypothetical protein VG297_24020 [Bryobacteraceae bacterium]|jgi:hypothetical protein|nr:hypothetical protein [Bryobacteraceae bacterium]